MSQTIALPAGGYAANPIFNSLMPEEGPKAIAIVVPLSTGTAFALDFGPAVLNKTVSCIQTIYVDNSNNGSPVSIAVDGNGQVITVPPNSQGYLYVLAQKQARFTVTSSGSADVPMQFLNFPVPQIVWPCLVAP